MTETPPPAPAPAAPVATTGPLNDERQLALIAYIAYLASFAFPVAALVGLVLAYVGRDDAPDWLKTHYVFQIRTFWIGLLYWVVSIVLCLVLIGVPLVFATIVWVIVRCALGLNRLMRREAYPNPRSWIT